MWHDHDVEGLVRENEALLERIAALEAEVAEDQQEHDRLMAYVKQIKPDAHSVYEVLDLLKARCAQAERELTEERAKVGRFAAQLGVVSDSLRDAQVELAEERARLKQGQDEINIALSRAVMAVRPGCPQPNEDWVKAACASLEVLAVERREFKRQRDEERALLRDAVAKSFAIYAGESEKGRSIDRSVTSAETLSSVMWSSGRLHGLGTIHDLLLGLLGALGDYRANAEVEAAASGAAEKPSGGD